MRRAPEASDGRFEPAGDPIMYEDESAGLLVRHEHDAHGSHRLVVLMRQDGDEVTVVTGPWALYQGVALVSYGDKHYIGTTEYHGQERVGEYLSLVRLES